jgi:hypothetical protein
MKADKYIIKWQYSGNLLTGTIFTYCYLIDGSAVYCGHSQCNANDNFCRATERKLSLARVLKKAELPKEERTKIWDAYRNMTAKKRW